MDGSRDVEAGHAWFTAVVDLLDRIKKARPDALAEDVNAATRRLGVEITIYLVDHEQKRLWPVPERGKPTPPPLSVSGTVAGRAFALLRTQPATERGGPHRLWIPMVDGAERLGVVEVIGPPEPAEPETLRRLCEILAGLVGHLVSVKMPYGDALHMVRRTRPMSPAAELLTTMLPPLTFGCEQMVISAVLEPCYEVGGDAFDYAVDGPIAWFSVLDAMGRGLSAGLTCATALAAVRAARRDGHGLYAMARAADAALLEQFSDLRFVTGVLAELDTDSGALRYINAGHPRPLLLRHGKAVRELSTGRRMPMGIDDSLIEVGEEVLEPGDRLLLYTDGVTDAYDHAGDRFGIARLVDLAERCAAAGLPAPETLRRLSHSVLEHQHGPPADDATLLLLEWSSRAMERIKV